MIINVLFSSQIKCSLQISMINYHNARKRRLKIFKIDFSCFLGCKYAKNTQNADLRSNSIAIQ
jgi:hypothetical protein